MRFLAQILRTKNDTNGNPRRITLVYTLPSGEAIQVLDQGDQIPREMPVLPSISIPASEYRRLLKESQR